MLLLFMFSFLGSMCGVRMGESLMISMVLRDLLFNGGWPRGCNRLICDFVDLNSNTTTDLGSGGGLPGIIVAIILKNMML